MNKPVSHINFPYLVVSSTPRGVEIHIDWDRAIQERFAPEQLSGSSCAGKESLFIPHQDLWRLGIEKEYEAKFKADTQPDRSSGDDKEE